MVQPVNHYPTNGGNTLHCICAEHAHHHTVMGRLKKKINENIYFFFFDITKKH